MKLTKKLIPLASVATAASIVTPLSLTSCGSISLTDITNMATPDFKQYSGQTSIVDIQSATDQYRVWCMDKDNEKDFIEDMKWGIFQNWKSYFDDFGEFDFEYQIQPGLGETYYAYHDGSLKSLQFGINKISFGKVEVGQPGSEKKMTLPTLSCKMKIVVRGEIDANFSNQPKSAYYEKHQTTITADVEYKDMPFFVYSTVRSDKSVGHSSTLDPLLYQQQWFVTTCQDSSTQELQRLNPHAFDIKYNVSYTDDVTQIIGGVPSKNTDERRGSASGDINSATKLETLNRYKDYSWGPSLSFLDSSAMMNAGTPGAGWQAWIQNNPQALVANIVLLDNATHYFKPGQVPLTAETGELGDNIYDAVVTRGGIQGEYYLPSFGINIPAGTPEIDQGKIMVETGVLRNNGFEPADWGKIKETTSDFAVDDPSRHYFNQVGPDDPIAIQPMGSQNPCTVLTWAPSLSGDKMFLSIPVKMIGFNDYSFDSATGRYIASNLTFNIPSNIDGAPTALRFTINFTDSRTEPATCLLDFSQPQMSREIVLDIAK